jgi:hypothetical protein
MGKAKQNRRIARSWAERLGTTAGVEAVDAYVVDEQVRGVEDLRASLLATIAPGQPDWDEGAAEVGEAEIDGCPSGYDLNYYAAYGMAARARVLELARGLP